MVIVQEIDSKYNEIPIHVELEEYLLCYPPTGFILLISIGDSSPIKIEVNRKSEYFEIKTINYHIVPRIVSFLDLINYFFKDFIASHTKFDPNIVVITPVIMHFERNDGNAFFFDTFSRTLVYDGQMSSIIHFEHHPMSQLTDLIEILN